jgi:ADP-ribose pyrophosphatase
MTDRTLNRWVKEAGTLRYRSDYFQVYTDVVRLPRGSTISYDWYSAKDFCVVVAKHNSKIIVIENYRYPADDWFLELPAGHIEDGETPTEAAMRELEEETGYRPQSLVYVHWYYVSSRSLQKGHVLYCDACVKTATKREEGELQRIKLVSTGYLDNKIREGSIRHAATIVGYSMVKARGLI